MTHTNGTTHQTHPLFEIQGLHVSVDGKEILRGVDLVVQPGEVHALMGPNGSGKSTLANALMGHPTYAITAGRVLLDGEEIVGMRPEERARRGLFLAFQYPVAIPGVATGNFLRAAVKSTRGEALNAVQFRKELTQQMQDLQIDPSFATRSLNEGFSGGEKKRAEVLQLAMLRPRVAILDEIDSGLDIDAVRIVSEGVNAVHEQRPGMSFLLITHYQRILNYIEPDKVHVLVKGRIVESGGAELVHQLEAEGYEPIMRRLGLEAQDEEVLTHGR